MVVVVHVVLNDPRKDCSNDWSEKFSHIQRFLNPWHMRSMHRKICDFWRMKVMSIPIYSASAPRVMYAPWCYSLYVHAT